MSARSEARAAGQLKYEGRPCRRCRATEKYTSIGQCVPCRAMYSLRWTANNPERAKQIRAKGMATFRQRKPELARARVRACRPDYQRRNKARYNAHGAAYLAAKDKRTPVWADRIAIRKVYEIGQVMSIITGKIWHVDHRIPLRGKRVSGLHVRANLQLLPGVDNVRKNNQFEVS